VGYKRKVYKLKWPEGHELHGLEVTTKGVSVRKAFELDTLMDSLAGEGSTESKVEIADRLFAEFAERLISWNLEEDDGTPVLPTLAGVQDQDQGFMLGLIGTWIGAVTSVDIPLPEGSANGQSPAPEASLPTESLSPSPQS
jgi:hypothetical protein